MAQFYVPFNDPALIDGAKYANEKRADKLNEVYPDPKKSLSGMEKNDPLLILAHGRYSTADQIGGELEGSKTAYLTAVQLAKQMMDDGLPPDVSDVRLLVCWSGYTGGTYRPDDTHKVKRTEGKAPFAGQLSSALKGAGCKRVIVTGYTGEIYLPSRKDGIKLYSVSMATTGQPGGSLADSAVGDANLSLLGILEEIGKDKSGAKLTTDLNTRTVWL